MTTLLLLSQNKSGAFKELSEPVQNWVNEKCKNLKPAGIQALAKGIETDTDAWPDVIGALQAANDTKANVAKALKEKCGSSMNPLLMAQLLGGGKKLDATTLMLMSQDGGSGSGSGLSPAAIYALTSGSSKIDATTLMLMGQNGMDEQTKKLLMYQMLSGGRNMDAKQALLLGGLGMHPQAAAGMSPDMLNMQGMLEESVNYDSDSD